MNMTRRRVLAMTNGALVLLATQGQAESWPSRPIRLIAPTGPGAATDVAARLLADGVGRALTAPIIVEDMPGASGILAHQFVARAAPDGYTLLFSNTSGMAINLISFRQLPYDPARDFIPVATVCSLAPQVLSVYAELPVRSLEDFIRYARTNRGRASIAFDTTAGAAAFAAKLINKRLDLGLIEVPYRSAAQMTQDVASGLIPLMMSSLTVARAVVEAGKVRRIAVTSNKRFPGLPELPPLSERVPGLVMNGWFGVVAPAGTPAEIIARLNGAIGDYLQGPEIEQKLIGLGLAPSVASTPASTAHFLAQERERWRAVAKELEIEPQ
jgi:tripartite-type tricarboxylate transporter receptor subunit TctC